MLIFKKNIIGYFKFVDGTHTNESVKQSEIHIVITKEKGLFILKLNILPVCIIPKLC